MKRICTPGKSKTRKGGLGKNGYPGGLKPERAIQAKEGLKRRLQSELSVLHRASSSAISKDVIGPVILLRKQGSWEEN